MDALEILEDGSEVSENWEADRTIWGNRTQHKDRERMFAERSPDRVGKPKQKHPTATHSL